MSVQKSPRIPYDEVSPLLKQIRETDAAIDSNRRLLAKMLQAMLEEIESSTREGRSEELAELASAAHKLAKLLYEERTFPWANIRRNLRRYPRFESTLQKVIVGRDVPRRKSR